MVFGSGMVVSVRGVPESHGRLSDVERCLSSLETSVRLSASLFHTQNSSMSLHAFQPHLSNIKPANSILST